MNKKGIYFLSSRQDAITKFKHFVNMQQILPGESGLQDLGPFDEGFCAQINTKVESVIVCFGTKVLVMKFMEQTSAMIGSAAKNGQEQMDFQAQLSDHETQMIMNYPKLTPHNNKNNLKTSAVSKDSEWRLLQDWSTCTVSCGGGTQTRQLICIKGTDGKDCEGSSIQSRACNTQPCTPIDPQDTKRELLPLVVKTIQATRRPQREEPCVIKESDLQLVRNDLKGFKIPPKMPARVIMNNSTLSIFMSDEFGDINFSSTLEELTWSSDPENNCITLTNMRNKDTREVCAMELSHESMHDQISSWLYNLDLFKNKCRHELDTASLGSVDNDEIVKNKKQNIDMEKKAL